MGKMITGEASVIDCPNCGSYDGYGSIREWCSHCGYDGPPPRLLRRILCKISAHILGHTDRGYRYCLRCHICMEQDKD